MSRSYKRIPICKDNGKGHKEAKRLANKRFRRSNIDAISKSNFYKKYSESYDIADYICYWPKERAINEYQNGFNEYLKAKYPTLDSFLQYWEKCMIKK